MVGRIAIEWNVFLEFFFVIQLKLMGTELWAVNFKFQKD